MAKRVEGPAANEQRDVGASTGLESTLLHHDHPAASTRSSALPRSLAATLASSRALDLDMLATRHQTPQDPLGRTLAADATGAEADAPRTIGRYVLKGRLGAGAMGVVHAAWDPELDRTIALKIVRARPGVSSHEVGGLAWLMREAQAMARVSHPNVIQVHDVGVIGDHIFIAMELADGPGFSGWLRQPRPWRDTVDRFIEVGRGLAAAHAAGLVHRDFKPDNVLLGRDGRPRVTDFGLARAAAADDPQRERPAGELTTSALATNITQIGTLLGTPAYMAPEQFTGAPVDARTDLFAFCVALYQALYGERPFAGEGLMELQLAVLGGVVREPPPGRKVPPWLRRVLLRGLRVDPAERFPDMDALLFALGNDPGRVARRRLKLAGVVALVALVIGLGWARLDERSRTARLCDGGEARAAAVWSPERQAQLRDVFVATGAPAAAATWTGLAEVVQKDMSQWTAMVRDTCEATFVRGELSEGHLELRMKCLTRHLQEVDALAVVFASADVEMVAQGFDALASLSPITACADTEALLRQVPPPGDPTTAAAVAAVRQGLVDVGAREHSGRYADASAEAARAVAAAEASAYPPVLAEALLARGRVEARMHAGPAARTSMLAALTLARAHRHDEVARDANIELIAVTGDQQGRFGEAELLAELAGAELERSPSPLAEARFCQLRGDLHWERARYDESLTDYRRSLELGRLLLGPDHPLTALSEQSLGRLLWSRGDKQEATRLLQDSRHRLAALLGADHPQIARALRQEGNAYWIGRDLDRALSTYRQALVIAEQHGVLDEIPKLLLNIGATLGEQGDLVAAGQHFRRALALDEARLGPDHHDVLLVLDNLADLLARAEDPAARAEARGFAERSLALRRSSLGADHPDIARSLIRLGVLEREQGRPAAARPLFAEAVALRTGVAMHPILLARAQYGLARSSYDLGEDRAHIRRLLDESAALFTADGEYGASELAALRQWRDEVGLDR